MPDLPDELKLLDPVAEPLSVHSDGLDQLRTGVLASPRPLHRRWTAPVAAAAAIVIAVSVVWSGMPGNGKGAAIPADSPSAQVPVNTWDTPIVRSWKHSTSIRSRSPRANPTTPSGAA